MPKLSVEVRIYDPAIPFKTFEVSNPGVDTWHYYVLITKDSLENISQVPRKGKETLYLSGMMSMRVPLVEIGIQIGTIKIDNVEALVVDEGLHGILLGGAILERIFNIGQIQDESAKTEDIRITSDQKDDPSALALEMYSVQTPVEIRPFENIIGSIRRLYNIILVSSNEFALPSLEDIELVIKADHLIPEELRLTLAWIDSGSIWLTLKSGSVKALRYLSSLFETSASAKLAQQMADAKKAETEAEITQATRDATAARIIEEQNMLKAENLNKTYDAWRNELRSHLHFADDLIAQISREDIAQELKRLKDEAIIEIVQQKILPVVRNVPLPGEEDKNRFLLPPSSLEE